MGGKGEGTDLLRGLGLNVGVDLECDGVHQRLVDEEDVEGVSRVVFEVVVPLAADVRGIGEGDGVAVFVVAYGVIL